MLEVPCVCTCVLYTQRTPSSRHISKDMPLVWIFSAADHGEKIGPVLRFIPIGFLGATFCPTCHVVNREILDQSLHSRKSQGRLLRARAQASTRVCAPHRRRTILFLTHSERQNKTGNLYLPLRASKPVVYVGTQTNFICCIDACVHRLPWSQTL